MRGFMCLFGLVFLLSLSSTLAWGAVKLGETCDGIAALRCDQGLWCEHPAGQCKFADGTGACAQEQGQACDALSRPVCGCDGSTYSNDCERRSKHVQLDHIGECSK